MAKYLHTMIEPEREPYRVREGGSFIAFVRDPDRKPTVVNRGIQAL